MAMKFLAGQESLFLYSCKTSTCCWLSSKLAAFLYLPPCQLLLTYATAAWCLSPHRFPSSATMSELFSLLCEALLLLSHSLQPVYSHRLDTTRCRHSLTTALLQLHLQLALLDVSSCNLNIQVRTVPLFCAASTGTTSHCGGFLSRLSRRLSIPPELPWSAPYRLWNFVTVKTVSSVDVELQ